MNNEMNAAQFAKVKHTGQIRKFTGEQYINHPMRVAKSAKKLGLSDDVILSAWLHDTVEDTDTDISEIFDLFGDGVGTLVNEMTLDKTQYSDQDSKARYITKKINSMSNDGFTLKLLDRLDNVDNLIDAPRKFAIRYYIETKYIMDNIRVRSPLDKMLVQQIMDCINPVYDAFIA